VRFFLQLNQRLRDSKLFVQLRIYLLELLDSAVLRVPRRLGPRALVREARNPLALTHGPSHLPPPDPIDVEASLAETEDFWVDWAARNQTRGEWSDAVTRSLITLKALTYAPTGGMVAAPTTSLPEKLGGVRNWDYRFCWLRDATLTLLALMNAGYYDEAQAWRDWLLRAAAGSPSQLQIMYGLAGERRLSEYEVPWLPGYEQSTPVRIGNAAHGQLQLDVYGEVVDTLFQGKRGGLETRPGTRSRRVGPRRFGRALCRGNTMHRKEYLYMNLQERSMKIDVYSFFILHEGAPPVRHPRADRPRAAA